MLPRVVLGHGASGTAASMRPWVEALAARGVAAEAIDLPRGAAERAVPVFLRAIDEAGERGRGVVAGGHSFGGRVASLAAAGDDTAAGSVAAPRTAAPQRRVATPRTVAVPRTLAGLVLLSYPLHRPGHPESWRERTAHWPTLRCPVLLLSGEADPFARLELLREAVRLLPDGELVTFPGVGHGLLPVLEDAADRVAAFVRGLG